MKEELEFSLLPVDKQEYEEDVRRSKRKRKYRKGVFISVDENEQNYLWNKFGHRLIMLPNGRIQRIEKE